MPAAAPQRSAAPDWPALPLEPWEATKETLHRYCRVVGNVRMQLEPPRNHWWHAPLYVATRGLTTGPMPSGAGAYAEILLDLVDHEAVVADSSGRGSTIAMRDGLTVAAFSERLLEALRACDVRPRLDAGTLEAGDEPPPDGGHRAYDPEAVHRFWTVLRHVELAYRTFGSRFAGKTSPIHLFWHSFDLAVTRFSGRKLVAPAAGAREPAYTHEVASFGFWAGDAHVREAAFYASAWPEPPGLAATPLEPGEARWTRSRGGSALALLPYEAVRSAVDPAAAVLAFCESAYQASAALAGWDVEALAAGPADWTD